MNQERPTHGSSNKKRLVPKRPKVKSRGRGCGDLGSRFEELAGKKLTSGHIIRAPAQAFMRLAYRVYLVVSKFAGGSALIETRDLASENVLAPANVDGRLRIDFSDEKSSLRALFSNGCTPSSFQSPSRQLWRSIRSLIHSTALSK